jgi:hypothetical protein
MPRVPCDGIDQRPVLLSSISVYRALLRKACIDCESGIILPDAFMPRPNGKDDDGLSVTVVTSRTKQGVLEGATAMAQKFNKVFGIAVLGVGKVREIDSCLNVVSAPLEEEPNHALITGVPRLYQNRVLAERLAGQLARFSQNVW